MSSLNHWLHQSATSFQSAYICVFNGDQIALSRRASLTGADGDQYAIPQIKLHNQNRELGCLRDEALQYLVNELFPKPVIKDLQFIEFAHLAPNRLVSNAGTNVFVILRIDPKPQDTQDSAFRWVTEAQYLQSASQAGDVNNLPAHSNYWLVFSAFRKLEVCTKAKFLELHRPSKSFHLLCEDMLLSVIKARIMSLDHATYWAGGMSVYVQGKERKIGLAASAPNLPASTSSWTDAHRMWIWNPEGKFIWRGGVEQQPWADLMVDDGRLKILWLNLGE